MKMTNPSILKSPNMLPLEEQETSMEIVCRRVIERRQEELAKGVQDAQREFQAGHCYPMMPDELMAEILS